MERCIPKANCADCLSEYGSRACQKKCQQPIEQTNTPINLEDGEVYKQTYPFSLDA